MEQIGASDGQEGKILEMGMKWRNERILSMVYPVRMAKTMRCIYS